MRCGVVLPFVNTTRDNRNCFCVSWNVYVDTVVVVLFACIEDSVEYGRLPHSTGCAMQQHVLLWPCWINRPFFILRYWQKPGL